MRVNGDLISRVHLDPPLIFSKRSEEGRKMTSPGASPNDRSFSFAKRRGTHDLLRNFSGAAASSEAPLMTSGENSEDELSGLNDGGQTLDSEQNSGVATASCEPPLATRFSSRKREPSPGLELTLAPPGFKKPKENYKNQRPRLSNLPPDLPRHFRRIIESLGGQEVHLVTEKMLMVSDLSSHLARLLLPENQFRMSTRFLRTEEKARLDLKMEIAVGVISSHRVEKPLKLKLWLMGKKEKVEGGPKPKPTRVYSLQGGWIPFAKENKLEVKDRVKVWSFRADDETHCDSLKFILVKLDGNDLGGGSGGDDRLSVALSIIKQKSFC